MWITKVRGHILQTVEPEKPGYTWQFYAKRSTHLVEIETAEGITGWAECFGPGKGTRTN